MVMFLYEIAERHRRPVTREDRQQAFAIMSALGRILPGDLGKRVYLTGSIIQIENDEQRAKRQRAVSTVLRRFGPPPR